MLHIYIYREREKLMEKIKKVVTGCDEVEEERNADWIWILDLACRNESHNLMSSNPIIICLCIETL